MKENKYHIYFILFYIIYKIIMKKTKKGGARRAKSATRRKRTKSPPKLHRIKSVRSKPSGVFTRYVNRNGEIKQIPKGPPNCTKNHSDIKKGDCFIDPINLDCLTKDEVVQNPTDDKKCFNRNEICRWLRTKPAGVNDDPETRKNFPAGWQVENCNIGTRVRNSPRLINQERFDREALIRERIRLDDIRHEAFEADQQARILVNRITDESPMERMGIRFDALRAADRLEQANDEANRFDLINIINNINLLLEGDAEGLREGSIWSRALNYAEIFSLILLGLELDFDELFNLDSLIFITEEIIKSQRRGINRDIVDELKVILMASLFFIIEESNLNWLGIFDGFDYSIQINQLIDLLYEAHINIDLIRQIRLIFRREYLDSIDYSES